MAATETDDMALLRAWRGGDDRAGTTLFRRHFPSVFVFFRNKVNDGIEDLVQQTFLGCVEAGDSLDRVRSFRGYLFGIARHQLLRRFAADDSRKLRELADLPLAQLTGPSGVMARHDEQRVLLDALRRLPLDIQITVELFYWERLKITEIAEALDIPLGTVKSRLHRARLLLREEIARSEAAGSVLQSTIDDLDAWARSLRDLFASRMPDT